VLTPLANQLSLALATAGVPSFVDSRGVRLKSWPTVVIAIDHVDEERPTDASYVIHAEVTFAYNHAVAESFVHTCVTGSGPDQIEAIADAGRAWMLGWAPPLVSVLNCGATLDAEWFPAGDADGLCNWDGFSSPYVLRGPAADRAKLELFVEGRPLLAFVRDELSARLDDANLLHTVSLFFARSRASESSEVQIDGKIHPDLGARLAQLRFEETVDYASIRQNLVLFRPAPGET
jgi:hypothetical protein